MSNRNEIVQQADEVMRSREPSEFCERYAEAMVAAGWRPRIEDCISARPVVERAAEHLHERFAPDYEAHWSELDEDEREESEYLDMARALGEAGLLDGCA